MIKFVPWRMKQGTYNIPKKYTDALRWKGFIGTARHMSFWCKDIITTPRGVTLKGCILDVSEIYEPLVPYYDEIYFISVPITYWTYTS